MRRNKVCGKRLIPTVSRLHTTEYHWNQTGKTVPKADLTGLIFLKYALMICFIYLLYRRIIGQGLGAATLRQGVFVLQIDLGQNRVSNNYKLELITDS